MGTNATTRERAVGYVLMGYPRVSETFIASEILRVEQAGVPLRLFVIKPVEEKERGHRHPVVDRIAATPEYLPDSSSLTAPLHCWRPRHLKPFAPALKRVARRRPRGLARALKTALAQAARDRRTPVAGLRKIYVKELLQAVALADRLLHAPEVRHLHAHFAHGTTTVTWLAAQITGLDFSFTGHARDIYAPQLNPHGWLRRKLAAARFVVTCTNANVEHLRRIAPRARIHLVYHGLSADFAHLLAAGDDRRAGNGRLHVLGVGRLVAKKGFDTLVEACAVLQRRGVPFEALIVGQDDKHGDAIRRRIAELELEDKVRLPGAMGPPELLDEYRRASALCMPCRLLPDDRDGIPNVLVEAMATGTPVVATGVSGIPELVTDGVNGLLVEPEQPEQLADALVRLHEDRALAARLGRAAQTTVAERFDGDRLAQELAQLFEEAMC
jgi:glycosyltransferase involved in cell wall biosynthesis